MENEVAHKELVQKTLGELERRVEVLSNLEKERTEYLNQVNEQITVADTALTTLLERIKTTEEAHIERISTEGQALELKRAELDEEKRIHAQIVGDFETRVAIFQETAQNVAQKQASNDKQAVELTQKEEALRLRSANLEAKEAQLSEKESGLDRLADSLKADRVAMLEKEAELSALSSDLDERASALTRSEGIVRDAEKENEALNKTLIAEWDLLADEKHDVEQRLNACDVRESAVLAKETALNERELALNLLENNLKATEKQLQYRESDVSAWEKEAKLNRT